MQVARIQRQVLDAVLQESQLDPAIQEAIARLNSQLFDVSMVSHICGELLRAEFSLRKCQSDDSDSWQQTQSHAEDYWPKQKVWLRICCVDLLL